MRTRRVQTATVACTAKTTIFSRGAGRSNTQESRTGFELPQVDAEPRADAAYTPGPPWHGRWSRLCVQLVNINCLDVSIAGFAIRAGGCLRHAWGVFSTCIAPSLKLGHPGRRKVRRSRSLVRADPPMLLQATSSSSASPGGTAASPSSVMSLQLRNGITQFTGCHAGNAAECLRLRTQLTRPVLAGEAVGDDPARPSVACP